MRKAIVAVLILLVVGLSACSKEPNVNSGDESINSSNNNSIESIPPAPSFPDVPKKELEEAAEEFRRNISSFSTQQVKEVRIQYNPPLKKTYQSSDPEVIRSWIELLNRMDLEAIRYDLLGGTGFSLYLETEEEHWIGGFMASYIYTSSQRTLIHLKNYAELESDFQAILIKMGVDPLYV